MINGKTASLFSAACQVGGISAAGTKNQIDALKSFGKNIGNEISRISLSTSFRPVDSSVIKISYQYNWLQDFTDNSIRRAGIQLGIATYF